jgi:hypothetical protein
MRGIVDRGRQPYDASVPYRRQAIVLLVLLAAVLYAGERWREQDDSEFRLTPEMIEAIQNSKLDPGVYEAFERARERDRSNLRRITVDPQPPPPSPPVPTPSARRFVDVTLDPSGRPYDTLLRKGAKVGRRPLAVLHAPSRRVLFVGGEGASYVQAGEHEPVTLAERAGRRYPVHAVWLDEKSYDAIVGVVIVERESPVARWRQLDPVAYGTDAGLGAITTFEWAARKKAISNEVSRRYWKLLVEQGRQSFVADVDRHDGVDTIVFSNGFGDGGFPSIAGYDASGRRAQIVLWTIVVPWRVAFPEGRPPSQVTERENELAACLAGDRRIDGARCRLAPR